MTPEHPLRRLGDSLVTIEGAYAALCDLYGAVGEDAAVDLHAGLEQLAAGIQSAMTAHQELCRR